MGTIIDCVTGKETQIPDAYTPVAAPDAVTPLQMRRALRAAGLKGGVEAFLTAAGEEAQEAWEYATEIRRDDALVAAAAQALGKTSDELDNLFRAAAAISSNP